MSYPPLHLLRTHLRILDRYRKTAALFILVALYTVLGYYVAWMFGISVHLPFVTMLMNLLVAGYLFSEIFVGAANERIFYFLLPAKLEHTILLKNIAVALIVISLPIPFFLLETAFLGSTFTQLLEGVLFFIMAVPILLFIGNVMSAFFKRKQSFESMIKFMVIQGGMFTIASIPYILLYVWLQQVALCLLYSILVWVLWYSFAIPVAANMLRRRKIDIIAYE